jgi:hypothetical protein
MAAAAPRISRRLLEALVKLDDQLVPIAETYRQIGSEADRLGLTRPSYEQVRVLIHRTRRMRSKPTTTSVLLDVMARARPPEALLDHASGIGVRELRR